MHNQAKLYLPAIPYLIGVGLQVSGRTHFWLAFMAFELAAIISAGVIWSYWADWRETALAGGHPSHLVQRALQWSGVTVRRMLIRPELIAATIIFVLANGAISGFFALTEAPSAPTAPHVGSAKAAELAKFYGELGGYFYAQLPKDMSDSDFDQWQGHINDEIDKITAWMRVNMAPSAEYKFGDVVHLKRYVRFTDVVSEKHNREKNMLLVLQENLQEMMATDAWDKPDDKKAR